MGGAWGGGSCQRGANQEQATVGTAKFGTTKVCQMMPRHLKVQSHFSRCHFFGLLACTGLHCAQQQASGGLQEIRGSIQAAIRKPPRNSTNQPKARRKCPPPSAGCVCSCAAVWELFANFCSGIEEWVSKFLRNQFRHSKFRMFLISPLRSTFPVSDCSAPPPPPTRATFVSFWTAALPPTEAEPPPQGGWGGMAQGGGQSCDVSGLGIATVTS